MNRVVVNDFDEEFKSAEKSKIPYRIKRIGKWVTDFKSDLTLSMTISKRMELSTRIINLLLILYQRYTDSGINRT